MPTDINLSAPENGHPLSLFIHVPHPFSKLMNVTGLSIFFTS